MASAHAKRIKVPVDRVFQSSLTNVNKRKFFPFYSQSLVQWTLEQPEFPSSVLYTPPFLLPIQKYVRSEKMVVFEGSITKEKNKINSFEFRFLVAPAAFLHLVSITIVRFVRVTDVI